MRKPEQKAWNKHRHVIEPLLTVQPETCSRILGESLPLTQTQESTSLVRALICSGPQGDERFKGAAAKQDALCVSADVTIATMPSAQRARVNRKVSVAVRGSASRPGWVQHTYKGEFWLNKLTLKRSQFRQFHWIYLCTAVLRNSQYINISIYQYLILERAASKRPI